MQTKTSLINKSVAAFSLNILNDVIDAQLEAETKVGIGEDKDNNNNNWLFKVDVTISEPDSNDFTLKATIFYSYQVEFEDDNHSFSEDFLRGLCSDALLLIDNVLETMGHSRIGFV